jgi:phytoene/squalene synthetase
MPDHFTSTKSALTQHETSHRRVAELKRQVIELSHSLPISITKAASKQTYSTIQFLVDRDRVLDAFRAYAYFRWVDDQLDQVLLTRAERLDFVEREQQLIESGYCGEWYHHLTLEEAMLKDLLQNHPDPDSGLAAYIRNMMAVMAFDAERKDRLISQQELNDYTCYLATAVTEGLHYFIGHTTPSPQSDSRYLAVTGAHITHMLRDTFDDIKTGYFNIPCEFLQAYGIAACDVGSDAYREWIKSRVQLARISFTAGKRYLSQVASFRCRLAGFAYTARFESILDTIEQEGYQLRPVYPERKSLRGGLQMGWSALLMLLGRYREEQVWHQR